MCSKWITLGITAWICRIFFWSSVCRKLEHNAWYTWSLMEPALCSPPRLLLMLNSTFFSSCLQILSLSALIPKQTSLLENYYYVIKELFPVYIAPHMWLTWPLRSFWNIRKYGQLSTRWSILFRWVKDTRRGKILWGEDMRAVIFFKISYLSHFW